MILDLPPAMICTQIRWSGLAKYFQFQWSQYLVFQQAGHFTDVTLQLRDGSVSLHQAVLVPLSRMLLFSTTMLSMTDNPLVLLLPDYDLSIAECLVSLLYTGRYLY